MAKKNLDRTDKLYLTKEECLNKTSFFVIDDEGRRKIVYKDDSGPQAQEEPRKNQGPNFEKSKERARAYRKEDEKKVKASFPSELTAGFWHRFLAFILDLVIATALSRILVDGVLDLTGTSLSPTFYKFCETLVVLIYFTLTTYFLDGQTLGKMVFGLRVVRMDGDKLNFSTVFIREFIGRFIHSYSFLFLLYAITGFTQYNQNLSDIFADTTVVSLEKVRIYGLA